MIDRQKVLETINGALKAVRGLRQAVDKDNSTLAEIESQVLLVEVKSLLEMLEAEKDDGDEGVLHPQTGDGSTGLEEHKRLSAISKKIS